jgi:hypothetical protein
MTGAVPGLWQGGDEVRSAQSIFCFHRMPQTVIMLTNDDSLGAEKPKSRKRALGEGFMPSGWKVGARDHSRAKQRENGLNSSFSSEHSLEKERIPQLWHQLQGRTSKGATCHLWQWQLVFNLGFGGVFRPQPGDSQSRGLLTHCLSSFWKEEEISGVLRACGELNPWALNWDGSPVAGILHLHRSNLCAPPSPTPQSLSSSPLPKHLEYGGLSWARSVLCQMLFSGEELLSDSDVAGDPVWATPPAYLQPRTCSALGLAFCRLSHSQDPKSGSARGRAVRTPASAGTWPGPWGENRSTEGFVRGRSTP